MVGLNNFLRLIYVYDIIAISIINHIHEYGDDVDVEEVLPPTIVPDEGSLFPVVPCSTAGLHPNKHPQSIFHQLLFSGTGLFSAGTGSFPAGAGSLHPNPNIHPKSGKLKSNNPLKSGKLNPPQFNPQSGVLSYGIGVAVVCGQNNPKIAHKSNAGPSPASGCVGVTIVIGLRGSLGRVV